MSLNGILSEMSMLDIDRNISASETFQIPDPPRKSTIRGSNIQEASPPKANHGEGDNPRGVGAFDPYDFIPLVRGNLNVERINLSLASLRAAFICEKEDLEVELSRLTRTMDSEVDSISKARSPPMSPDVSKKCSHCFGTLEHGHLEISASDLLCQRCRRQKKLHGRLSKNVDRALLGSVIGSDLDRESTKPWESIAAPSRSSVDYRDDSQEFQIRSGGNTKFKSRIKAAMDDHHFLDDFR